LGQVRSPHQSSHHSLNSLRQLDELSILTFILFKCSHFGDHHLHYPSLVPLATTCVQRSWCMLSGQL
jgi:hypothetical protein